MTAAGWTGRALILASLAGLAVSGGVRAVVAVLAAVALFIPAPRVPGPAWIGAHIGVLSVSGVLGFDGRGEDALAVLVGWLVVHRQWTGRSAQDARIGVLFATLLTLLAGLGSEEFALGPAMVLFLALLPATLLRIETGEPTGLRGWGVAIATLTLGGGLYLLLPRLHGGYLAPTTGAGVSESVTLGDDEDFGGDQAIALRILVKDSSGNAVPGPFHIRGRALDSFDGTTWTSTFRERGAPRPDPEDIHLTAQIEQEPMSGSILFGVPEIVGIRGLPAGASFDANGNFGHRQPPTRLTYLALSRVHPLEDALALTGRQEGAYLQLPDVDPRIYALARSIEPAETNPRRVADALTAWLGENRTYVESPPPPLGDPLVSFLIDAQPGHCEYFASALTVMLRVREVPARLATGFWSGELDSDGERIVVRRGQAHAWVEVPLASGWTTFDPSPVAALPTMPANTLSAWLDRWSDRWNRWVIEFNLDRQVEALAQLGASAAGVTGSRTPSFPAWSGLKWVAGGIGVLYGVAVVVQLAAGRVLIPTPGAARDPLARIVRDARRLAHRRGWRIPSALPAGEAAEWLVREAGPSAEPFRSLAATVYRARYGGFTEGAIHAARAQLRALGGLVKREVTRR